MSSTVDVEWDEQQQGWMLALAAWDADTCHGCGGQLSETAAMDEWGESARIYEIQPPHRCYRCTEVARGRERVPEHVEHPQALLFSTTDTARPTRR